jgi:hypothetical protein
MRISAVCHFAIALFYISLLSTVSPTLAYAKKKLPKAKAAKAAKTEKAPISAQIKVEPGDGKVTFVATGTPSALKINGKMVSEGEKSPLSVIFHMSGLTLTGHAEFQLASLDTGLDLRNKHMKEKYLETEKYPLAEFIWDPITLPAQFTSGTFAGEFPATGELKLRGVTRKLTGLFRIERNATEVQLRYTTSLKLSDFKIETPSYMGISVSEEISLETDLKGKIL